MKAIKIQCLGILLLTQLAGCLWNNSTTATTSSSAQISYDGSTDPATLTEANSAALLAGTYQGGQAGTSLGSSAGLTNQNQKPLRPRTLLLSQILENAVQQAIQNGGLTHANAATITNVSNQVAGNCGGQMNYTGTVNDENREFYTSLSFDNYCNDATTLNGSANASGQTDTNPYDQDMFNNKDLAPNPFSITFDALSISSAGGSFTANGYALITKVDEPDLDESPDTDASTEPINPNNTPDADDSPTNDEQPDVGGVTTIKFDWLLRDDATKDVYKFENFNVTLTNGVNYVDASLSGRYYDPKYGYVDISTPTPLQINNTDYWPSSGIFRAAGNNDTASFTALSNTTYQLDIDSNDDGTPDVTTTGSWSDL
jgi:hypothetical protein